MALFLGFRLRIASAAAIVMLAGFLIANSLFLSFGIPCACMGDILQVLPYAIAFDVLLLGMAIWVFVNGGGVRLYRVPSKEATI